jgi:hypothetical protein
MPLSRTAWHCERIVHKPKENQPFQVSLKVAEGDWQVVSRAKFSWKRKVSGNGFIGSPINDGVFPIDIPTQWKSYNWRIVCFGLDGAERLGTPSNSPYGFIVTKTGDRTPPIMKFCLFGLPIQEITRVELQVRPFHTVRFSNIHPVPLAVG